MLCCRACGYRSENANLFRSEPAGGPGKERAYCLGCKPPPPFKRNARFIYDLVMLAAGVSFVQLGRDQMPPTLAGYLIIVSASIRVWAPLHIAVHEAGHAIMAWLVGYRVLDVQVGTEANRLRLRLFSTRIRIGANLFGGGITRIYAVPPRTGRWRMSLILLGGFAASVAFAALVTGLLALAAPWVSGPIATCLFLAGIGLAISEIVRAPFCLWPKVIRIGEARLASDGLALFRLWRKRRDPDRAQLMFDIMEGARLSDAGRWTEARAHYEAAHERDQAQGWHVGALLHVINRTEGARAVADWFMAHRSEIETQAALAPETWGYTFGNTAWQMVRQHDPELLPLALELSGRAMETASAYAPIRATRGAALLANGDPEGRAMLLAALPEIEDRDDRAEFIAFLGEEASRAGDDATGEALRGLEAHLLKAA